MGFLDGIKELWLREKKQYNSIGAPKVSKGNKVMRGVVSSSDNEKVETILNSIIFKISKIDRDDDGVSNLNDFLEDIVKREECIYPLIMDVCNWQYETSVKDNFQFHQFKLVSNDKRYIVIDVRSYVDGDILEFTAMYYSDISEYLVDRRGTMSISNIGSAVIKISYTEEGDIVLEDKIYSLDLLNNSYDEAVIDNNYLGGNKSPFGIKKKQR